MMLLGLVLLLGCGEDPERESRLNPGAALPAHDTGAPGENGTSNGAVNGTVNGTTAHAETSATADASGDTMGTTMGGSGAPLPPPPSAANQARLPDPPGPGPWFEIVDPSASGLSHKNLSGPVPAVGKRFLRDTIGQGIAVLDANSDGRLDLYFAQGTDGTDDSGDSANRLYLNQGDMRWAEQGAAYGVADTSYSFGALAFDYDNDGDEDLLISNLGPNRLLRNDGGRFTDVTAQHPGLAGDESEWSTGASAGDVDGDGDLDLYLANYVEQDIAALEARSLCMFMGCKVPCGPNGLVPQADHFFRNDGAPLFQLLEASAEAGFADIEPSYGFQPTFLDLDDDGDLDLYVTNDSVFNAMFINDGAGTFAETALVAGAACGRMGQLEAGMGLATGHPNGSSLPDLYVTNFSSQSNSYYSNQTDTADEPWFDEVSELLGCGRPTWFRLAWGTSFGDFDNDGLLDLFAANGHIYHHVTDCAPDRIVYEQENDLFRGTEGGFVDWAAKSGPAFASASSHRGAVTLDIEGDGDLDLVINRLDDRPLLALNTSPEQGHWLALEIRRRDTADATPTLAVGAQVTVHTDAGSHCRDVLAGSSFLCTESPRVHFGLGSADAVTSLSIRLPGRPASQLGALPVDKLLFVIVEPDGTLSWQARED